MVRNGYLVDGLNQEAGFPGSQESESELELETKTRVNICYGSKQEPRVEIRNLRKQESPWRLRASTSAFAQTVLQAGPSFYRAKAGGTFKLFSKVVQL